MKILQSENLDELTGCTLFTVIIIPERRCVWQNIYLTITDNKWTFCFENNWTDWHSIIWADSGFSTWAVLTCSSCCCRPICSFRALISSFRLSIWDFFSLSERNSAGGKKKTKQNMTKPVCCKHGRAIVFLHAPTYGSRIRRGGAAACDSAGRRGWGRIYRTEDTSDRQQTRQEFMSMSRKITGDCLHSFRKLKKPLFVILVVSYDIYLSIISSIELHLKHVQSALMYDKENLTGVIFVIH